MLGSEKKGMAIIAGCEGEKAIEEKIDARLSKNEVDSNPATMISSNICGELR